MSIRSTVTKFLDSTRKAGEELASGLEGIRGRISDLQAERFRIEVMPPPLETALSRIDDFVDSLGGHDRDVKRFIAGPGYYSPPVVLDRSVTLAVWMGPVIAAAMKAEVAKLYETTAGISEKERSEKLAAVDRAILDAELAEESMIRAAAAAGFAILRRHDANPFAVLAHDEALP